MKLIIMTAVSCMIIATVQADISTEAASSQPDKPKFGHFKDPILIEARERYRKKYDYKLSNGIFESNDLRGNLANGKRCDKFFTEFVENHYKLSDTIHLVLLDDCLAYLFENEKFAQKNSEKKASVESELPSLAARLSDKKLKKIYSTTRIEELDEGAKSCIAELVISSMAARKEYDEKSCDPIRSAAYSKFAKCHHGIPADMRTVDSYLSLIYKSIWDRSKQCLKSDLILVKGGAYGNTSNSMINFGLRYGGLDEKNQNQWPSTIREILSVALSIQEGEQIDLKKASKLISNEQQVLLENGAKWATKQMKVVPTLFSNKLDATGGRGYRKLVEDLCMHFQQHSSESYFDYVSPFERALVIVEENEVFKVNRELFILWVSDKLLWSIYLSVAICNILMHSEAKFDEQTREYQVRLMVGAGKGGPIKWLDNSQL